jgi:anthraniloyl-CoA monooxygenase
MSWWDSFPTRLDLPVEQLLVSYMTRAGKVSVDRFATSAAGVVRMALAQYGRCEVSDVDDGNRSEWVLRQPLGTAFASRRVRASEIAGLRPVHVTVSDPWGSAADTLVKEIGADEALSGVLLSTAADTGSVLSMFDLAERIRREVGTLVVAQLDASATDLAVGALVTERVDLVDLGGAA